MSQYGHSTEEEIKEHFEQLSAVEQKINKLVDLIKQSKHCIIFTGAGISTSAGIADFRGPKGLWTLASKGKRNAPKMPMSRACPTSTHMAIRELIEQGHCKYLVSQNVDGLHRRSGVHKRSISELHGNMNLEVCKLCDREYLRDFRARTAMAVHDHKTSRRCENPACKGAVLEDTIINFDEPLPEQVLNLAYEHARKADLCIVLGSSLTVYPAADIPKQVSKNPNGKLVIVNLQKTPLDKHSHLRIFARCDEVMDLVMDKLNIAIPRFILHRRILVKPISKKNQTLRVQSVDEEGVPVSMLKTVIFQKRYIMKTPMPFELDANLIPNDVKTVRVAFHFYGHYKEPCVSVDHPVGKEVLYLLNFNPRKGTWKIETSDA